MAYHVVMPPKSLLSLASVLVVLSIFLSTAAAQEKPGDGLRVLIEANDRFGTRLLQQAHSEEPEKNLVVAPLSLTILLGAIQTHIEREEARKEFDQVFGWGEYPDIRIQGRMILAAMDDRPRPTPTWHGIPDQVEPETLWIENRLLYRSPKSGPPLLDSRFVDSAPKDFGLQLVNTGDKNPSAADLQGSREQVGGLPHVSPLDQVWFSSGLHMRQTWEELFRESRPTPGEFRLQSGQTRTVLRIQSELRKLAHLKNEKLEAVALPCGRVLMIVVLPAPDMTIKELEQLLVAHPDALDGMSTSHYGSVTFPEFEIKTSVHLETPLKTMGISDIFQHLEGVTRRESFRNPRDYSQGMIPAAQSRVTDLAQTIDFGADNHGIHADAETLIGAVPMGIIMAQDTFHMFINRPFLFFVRETTTKALLVAAALMDPGDVDQEAVFRSHMEGESEYVQLSAPVVKAWREIPIGSPVYALDDAAGAKDWLDRAFIQPIGLQTGKWNILIEPGYSVFRIYPYLSKGGLQSSVYQGICLKVRGVLSVEDLRAAIRNRNPATQIDEYDVFGSYGVGVQRYSRPHGGPGPKN
jgi:serine protease inhibitor